MASAPINPESGEHRRPKVPARMDQQPAEQPLLPRRMDLPQSNSSDAPHQVIAKYHKH